MIFSRRMKLQEQASFYPVMMACLLLVTFSSAFAPNLSTRRTRGALHESELRAATPMHDLEAMLATLYTPSMQVVEAHGHSQPFFGPADPYLTAGKSIAPPGQNLMDMGITAAAKKSGGALLSTDSIATANQDLARQAQEAVSKGWKFLDSSSIEVRNLPGQGAYKGFMPGFVDPAQTSALHLAQPEPRLYADYNETPETFVLMVKWAASLIHVIDKLPLAALVYALIEFFILRPNLDTTKREIIQNEQPSSSVLAESVATTGVRLTVFLIVAILTLGIFG